MKIGIISNSELCVPLLHYLAINNVQVIVYLGSSAKNINNTSIISFCTTNNIPVEEEENKLQLYAWLKKQQPDYTFIFGYKYLVDIHQLEDLKKRIFNIHPGKLPEYRGANPIFWQLKNGTDKISLTLHLLSNGFDEGPILWEKEFKTEPHFTFGFVEFLFSNFLIEGVNFILSSDIFQIESSAIPQDETKAIYYKRPTLNDVLISWKTMTSLQVNNLVKACNPWNKGAITAINNMEIKILDMEAGGLIKGPVHPGTITSHESYIEVACIDNFIRINMFVINGIFVPARFADKYGLLTGASFTSF
jgi:methionyl-tRNA formyltransferase